MDGATHFMNRFWRMPASFCVVGDMMLSEGEMYVVLCLWGPSSVSTGFMSSTNTDEARVAAPRWGMKMSGGPSLVHRQAR